MVKSARAGAANQQQMLHRCFFLSRITGRRMMHARARLLLFTEINANNNLWFNVYQRLFWAIVDQDARYHAI